MQPVLALKCLDVLLNICTSHAPQITHQLIPSYNNALALYNDHVLSILGPRPHSLPKPLPLVAPGDLGRRELVEIECSQLMAGLASSRMQLAALGRGGCDDVTSTLLSMLSEPVLKQSSILTTMFVAKAKLLASEILQQKTFDLPSGDAFLHYVINNSQQSDDRGKQDHTFFRLTPLELTADAVKVFQKLADHPSVRIQQDKTASKSI